MTSLLASEIDRALARGLTGAALVADPTVILASKGIRASICSAPIDRFEFLASRHTGNDADHEDDNLTWKDARGDV